MGRRLFALSLALVLFAPACVGPSCDPGYDDTWVTTSRCDGNVLRTQQTACGEVEPLAAVDCGVRGLVCATDRDGNARCAAVCTDDTTCSPDAYCPTAPGFAHVCSPRLSSGADCSAEPKACAVGLACDPTGGPDVTAQCGPDCSKTDPGALICPKGAESICFDGNVYACDLCGVASKSTTCAAVGETTCAMAGTRAICVLSATPDPACGAGISYCDGATRVGCNAGFATARIECAPWRCMDNGGYAVCEP